MADPSGLEYIEEDDEFNYSDALNRAYERPPTPAMDARRAAERRRLFAAGFDLYLVLIVLPAIGTSNIARRAISIPFWMAAGTSLALP